MMSVVQMVLHQRNMLGRRRQHIRIEDKFAASFLLVFVRSVCPIINGWLGGDMYLSDRKILCRYLYI